MRVVYDAIKIALSFVKDNVVMNLLPTVHVLKSDGSQLDRFAYQNIVNNEMKSIDVLVYAFLSSMTTGKVCRHMVSSASLWKLFTY